MLKDEYPKEVMLKDGTEVVLRTLEREDEEGLSLFYRNLPSSDLWYMKEDPRGVEVTRKWIHNQMEGNALCTLATVGDRIVAHAAVLRRPFGGRRHVGALRIMVSPEFRSKRLGTWMIFDLIRGAMDMGLEKLRAEFIVGVDDEAADAVRRLDFACEATMKDAVRDQEGVFRDCRIMVKRLHHEWSDF